MSTSQTLPFAQRQRPGGTGDRLREREGIATPDALARLRNR